MFFPKYIFDFFVFFIFFVFLGRRVGRSPLNPPPPFGGRACGTRCQTLADSHQSLSDSKRLRRPPPYPPTLPKRILQTPFWPPEAATFSNFGRLFADQKSIKNQTLQKATQNLKSLTLERPNVDFGTTFGIHFGKDFHDFSAFVRKSVNP